MTIRQKKFLEDNEDSVYYCPRRDKIISKRWVWKGEEVSPGFHRYMESDASVEPMWSRFVIKNRISGELTKDKLFTHGSAIRKEMTVWIENHSISPYFTGELEERV